VTKLDVRIEMQGKKIMIYITINEKFISFIRGFTFLKWEKELRT
jgi:hypothetical protein